MGHQKILYLLGLVVLSLCLTACGAGTEKEKLYVENIKTETGESKEDDFVDTESMIPAGNSIEEKTEEEQPFYGVWEISSYQAEGITGHTLDEANAFLGFTITYQPDAIFQNEKAVNIENIVYKATLYRRLICRKL